MYKHYFVCRRGPKKDDVVYLPQGNGEDEVVPLDYVRYSTQKKPSNDLVSFSKKLLNVW